MTTEQLKTTELLRELTGQFAIASTPEVNEQLLEKIKERQSTINSELIKKDPFIEHRQNLNSAIASLNRQEAELSQVTDDFEHFKVLAQQTNIPIDQKYWLGEIDSLSQLPKMSKLVDKFNHSNKHIKKAKQSDQTEVLFLLRRQLHQQWQKLLDQQHSLWQLETINQIRNALLRKLKDWLNWLEQLELLLSNLSLGPGLLFDLSAGNLTHSDLEQLKKWAKYISEDPGVKRLCDLMGRLSRAEQNKKLEWAKSTQQIQHNVPDCNSREEYVGIRLGRDIEYALPHELALLADPETTHLFELKLLEGQLMCFDVQGMSSELLTIEKDVQVETTQQEKLGPIIICVDTSGSMQGAPETIAKAITLFIATRALNQKRHCYLINFSTQIQTLNLSDDMGIEKVIRFLQKSFHGGTDVTPALAHAAEIMNKKDYSKADLLVISDFVLGSIGKTVEQSIAKAKQSQNKFYSLAIGDLFLHTKLKSIFDRQWVYNPQSCSIGLIQSMGDILDRSQ